jgi:hypothetical protein
MKPPDAVTSNWTLAMPPCEGVKTTETVTAAPPATFWLGGLIASDAWVASAVRD